LTVSGFFGKQFHSGLLENSLKFFVHFKYVKHQIVCLSCVHTRDSSLEMTVTEEEPEPLTESLTPTHKKEYELLEDLPGVGPATSKKLQEMGFHTIESLATATARELEPAGISEKKALQVIRLARGTIDLAFIRADELLKQRQTIKRLTIGSQIIDDLLGGGLETQTITEFYGEYGSGKSQLCHQLCINVQLPLEQGGLEAAALYIDTENTFRTERLVSMAQHLGLEPTQAARNVIVADAYTSDHQIFLLENADKIIKDNNIRLIIIDSLTSHFRSEYIGRGTLAERQQKLNKHMHKLIRLARAFNAAAVVTNQVMAKPDVFFGDAVHPIGGHIVAHTSHTRVYLRKASRGPVRIARLVSSPYLPDGEGIFKITQNGIEEADANEHKGR
jgi:DNA repair protein RadA